MSNDEDVAILVNAVRMVFEEERTAFWVSPEAHYLDHKFVKLLRKVIAITATTLLTVTIPVCLYILASHWPTP